MDLSVNMTSSNKTELLRAQTLLQNYSKETIKGQSGSEKSELHVAAKKAASEFEAVYLTTMLEGMFTGLDTEAPFGGGSGEKSYRSLLVGEYAKEMSQTGGIGIADHVYREILAIQESSRS